MKKYVYNGKSVTLSAEEYRSNNTLALMLHYDDGETEVITVNLQDPIQSSSLAYLDTNNQPGIEKFIQKNGLGLPMGVLTQSGFCKYPLYTIFTSEL
jgi:hypothetical protein